MYLLNLKYSFSPISFKTTSISYKIKLGLNIYEKARATSLIIEVEKKLLKT